MSALSLLRDLSITPRRAARAISARRAPRRPAPPAAHIRRRPETYAAPLDQLPGEIEALEWLGEARGFRMATKLSTPEGGQ